MLSTQFAAKAVAAKAVPGLLYLPLRGGVHAVGKWEP